MNMQNTLYRVLPFLETIKNYSVNKGKADFLAGITVAIVASPQAMAYAMIAGLDPVYGLYASIFPVIITALFASSQYQIAGPTNAVAMVVYSSLAQLMVSGAALLSLPEEARLPFVFMFSILTGIIQLSLGLTRLGDLANFISDSVLLGFMTGASMLIAIGQIRPFLGLEFEASSHTFTLIRQIVENITTINYYTFFVSCFTIVSMLIIRKYLTKIYSSLIALILTCVITALFGLGEKGVVLSAAVTQSGLPFYFPDDDMLLRISELFSPAFALALISAVSAVAIGRAMASQKNEIFSANQELVGLGLGNIVAGFCCGMPGGGSFSRSAVNYTSGAQTRFAAVISGFLTLLLLLVAGPYINYIPIAALAAILMVICYDMINIKDIVFISRVSRTDSVTFLVTLISVFAFGLEVAVFLGVFLSLSLFLKKQSHLTFHPLEKEMIASEHYLFECNKVKVYELDGALFFGAVSELEKDLKVFENFQDREECVIILNMNGVNMLDASGAHAFRNFFTKVSILGIRIILCTSNASVYTTFEKTGILKDTHIPLVHNLRDALSLAETDIACSRHCETCTRNRNTNQIEV